MTAEIYKASEPRQEVLEGELTDAMFAANLDEVVGGTAPPDYVDPNRFFLATHPSSGLRALLDQALGRLRGKPEAAPVIRLETSYGGGKSHNLIALYHAARGGLTPLLVSEFMNPANLPDQPIDRIAVAVGSSVSAVSFQTRHGITPKTVWGDLALQLGGPAAYEAIRREDEAMTAAHAEGLKRVFGDEPNLILLDEMGRYLAAAAAVNVGATNLAEQVIAFLMSLFEAAAASPRTVVVVTLSEHQDAFAGMVDRVSVALADARKVTGRHEIVLSAAGEADLPAILTRRLFTKVDSKAAREAAQAYGDALKQAHERGAELPDTVLGQPFVASMQSSFPFHPELIKVLDSRLSTIPNFQRTRGALRLLAHVIRALWEKREPGVLAIHLHGVDLSRPEIAQELTSRLDRAAFESVIRADIAAAPGALPAHAQRIDKETGAPHPYAQRAATAIFLHSLTSGVPGVPLAELLGSLLTPGDDPAVVHRTIGKLEEAAWYLDSTAGSYRFGTEPNLNKLVADEMQGVSVASAKSAATERIASLFKSGALTPVFTWTGGQPADKARPPQLVLFHFDDLVSARGEQVPSRIQALYERSPAGGLRQYRNALVFLCAAKDRVEAMVAAAKRWLALEHLNASPDLLARLTDQLRERLRKLKGEQDLMFRVAIGNAYCMLYVPREGEIELIELPAVTTATPNQNHTENVVKALENADKLLTSASPVPDPAYVRQKVWPHGASSMTTNDLVDAYASRPGLKIVLDQGKLLEVIGAGVRAGLWEYHDSLGDKWWAKTDTPLSARLAVDTQLYMPGSRPAPPPPDKTDEATCPICGKPAHPGACDVEKRELFEQSGPANLALKQVREQAASAKVDKISEVRIRVTAEAELMRTRLPRLLALGSGAPVKRLSVRLSGVSSGEGSLDLSYAGPASAYDGLKSSVQTALGAARQGTLDAMLVIGFDPAVSIRGAEYEEMVSRATDSGPDMCHVTVVASSEVVA
jgi:Protein of unknown function (DUF499)